MAVTPRLSRARAYVGPRLNRWMEAAVQLRRALGVNTDLGTGYGSVSYDSPYYDGEAGIWLVNRGPVMFLGDAGGLETRVATVSLPVDAPKVKVDDQLVVVTCVYDTDLEGRTGTVESVGGGGRLRGSRIITVRGLYESDSWSP